MDSTLRRAFSWGLLFFSITADASEPEQKSMEVLDLSTKRPGDVISEQTYPLPLKGYRVAERSIVNDPKHWEAVGHFVYVLYEDVVLCQCGPSEVAISPDGAFAIILETPHAPTSSWRLMLFKSSGKLFKPLRARFQGVPISAKWDMAARKVQLKTRTYSPNNLPIYKWEEIRF